MKNISSYITALLLLLGVGPALLSCEKPTTSVNEAAVKRMEKYKVIDDSVIRAYLVRNNIAPGSYTRTSEGVYLVSLTSNPQGALAANGKRIAVKLEGSLITKEREKTIIETTYNGRSLCDCRELLVGDNKVMPGLNVAFPLMRQGEHKLALIPSYLAYGPLPEGMIPADSPLLYDLVIMSVAE